MPLNRGMNPERKVVVGILSGLANDPGAFFTDKLLPATPGAHKGDILTLTGGTHFGMPGEDGRRAPGGQVSRGPGASFGDVDYTCQQYDREELVPKELIRRSADQLPIPLLQLYMAMALDFLRVGRDKRAATLITGTTWGYEDTPAGGDKWDTDTGKPVNQIKTAVDAIKGGKPNVILFGHGAFSAFQTNSNILSAMSVNADRALADMNWFKKAVANFLGLGQCIVVESLKNTSGNPESLTLTRILDKTVWIGCIGEHPGAVMENGDLVTAPTAMARVVESDFEMDEYEVKTHKSRAVQVGHSEDMVAVTTALGARLDDVIS